MIECQNHQVKASLSIQNVALTGGGGDQKSYFEHAARRPLTVQYGRVEQKRILAMGN